jgi:quercetin dioxygenase-like cupin family protein
MFRTRPITTKVTASLSVTAMALSIAAVVAPQAAATSPIGVSAEVLSKNTADGRDYIVSDITIAPGGSTGWHTHRGVIFGIVKAGELTHYSSDCQQDGIYGVGVPITDPTGPEHVHIGRNLGTTPLVLEVTYIDPAGAPTSDSVPNPGCDFE